MSYNDYFEGRQTESGLSITLKYAFGTAFIVFGLYLRHRSPIQTINPTRHRTFSGHFFCIFRGTSFIAQAISSQFFDGNSDGWYWLFFGGSVVLLAFSVSWLFMVAGPLIPRIPEDSKWLVWDILCVLIAIICVSVDLGLQAYVMCSTFDIIASAYLGFVAFVQGLSRNKLYISLFMAFTVINICSYIFMMASNTFDQCLSVHCDSIFDILHLSAIVFFCVAIVYEEIMNWEEVYKTVEVGQREMVEQRSHTFTDAELATIHT